MTADGAEFIYLFIHSFLVWIASILEEIKKKKKVKTVILCSSFMKKFSPISNSVSLIK